MHTIRLRNPWTADWLETLSPAQPRQSVVLYERKFHAPTGLEHCSVELAVAWQDALPAALRIQLNERSLPLPAELAPLLIIPISGQLLPFNTLQLEIELPGTLSGQSAGDPACPPLSTLAEVTLRIAD